MLWDLIQQVQLSDQQSYTESLERKVNRLEKELHVTNESLRYLTEILEQKFGEGLSSIPDFGQEPEVEDTNHPPKVKSTHALETRDQLLKKQIQRSKQRLKR